MNATAPRRKVLVVDDDAETSRVVDDILKALGYETVLCRYAQEAIAYIESHPVDLMLIDYRMPDLTGLDLISLLHEAGWEIPMIMMTGYSETKDRISTQALGTSAILLKPITVPILTEALEKVFRPKTIQVE